MAARAAKAGDTVAVHYTGTLEDGEVFDSSDGREPLEFKLGAKMVVPGFENAVEGLVEGEKVRTTMQPEDAYGPHRPELAQEVERAHLPTDVDLEVGQRFRVTAGGATSAVTVTKIEDDMVTLDGNHPLAGKALTFDIELVSITEG